MMGKIFMRPDIYERTAQSVGLVFQYPEHQLFEVDVLKDVCFGPKSQGLPKRSA